MSQLGVGAMVGRLSGDDDTVAAYHRSMGKPIASVLIDDDANGGDGACIIRFADGAALRIFDDGRSCCESRYLTCDDDLASFQGAILRSIDLRAGADDGGDYDVHETQFVTCETDRGALTLCTHNLHNGYYGGFWMRLEYAEPRPVGEPA